MSDASNFTTIYTTASNLLDLPTTEVLKAQVGVTSTGHPVRKVSVHLDDLARQKAQYVSHLETVLSEQDWKIELQFGNVSEKVSGEAA